MGGTNNKLTAVLLDTVSIQKYIFSGRKLQEFIGASYIVDWIYDEPILSSLKDLFGTNLYNLTDWVNNPNDIGTLRSAEFEVGYIGGGNALLFFKDSEKAKNFVKIWTRYLLYLCPGLIPSIAIYENFDFNSFQSSIKNLFGQLEKNKYSYTVNAFIPKHGISAECRMSGGAKEVYHKFLDPKDSDFISSVLKTKLIFTIRGNNHFHESLIRDNSYLTKEQKNCYQFPAEIDHLGQIKGKENYIAIVHIDGNSTGQLFLNCDNLKNTRELSIYLKEKTREAMAILIRSLIGEIENDDSPVARTVNLAKVNLTDNKSITYLPIRPIILGGDDVTFISHGKLGIWLAENFIKIYKNLTEQNCFNHSLSAGVLITKSHMPFYRAYRLSEELCSEAKKKRMVNENTGNWIDFHIAYGGFSGTISEIRERHYKVNVNGIRSPLFLRPYPLSPSRSRPDIISFSQLKTAAQKLKTFPHSKLLELRKILASGDETGKRDFLNNLKIRRRQLPEFNGHKYHQEIWDNYQTPYFDLIELIEFYPL